MTATSSLKPEVQTSDLASPCGLQGNAQLSGLRVLFLDVDGVLNSHRTVITSGNCAHPHNYAERRAMFDWTAITMLQGLCRVADLRVVLSSSWRCGMSKDELAKFGAFLGLPIIDMTPQKWTSHQTRGHEIKEWLDDHLEVTHYAIVDDDCDMLPGQMTRYVQTFYEDGLTWAPFSKLCDMFSVSPFACAVERVAEATPASSSPDEKQDAAALQVPAGPLSIEDVHSNIREAGGIVHRDGNVFFSNAEQFIVAAVLCREEFAAGSQNDTGGE